MTLPPNMPLCNYSLFSDSFRVVCKPATYCLQPIQEAEQCSTSDTSHFHSFAPQLLKSPTRCYCRLPDSHDQNIIKWYCYEVLHQHIVYLFYTTALNLATSKKQRIDNTTACLLSPHTYVYGVHLIASLTMKKSS